MRTIVGVAAGCMLLFIAISAFSQQSQSAADATNTESANATYETVNTAIEGMTQGGGEAIIWFGVAAVVLAACGLLLAAAMGGGR